MEETGPAYEVERDELGWYYAGLGGTVGLRAAPIEPTGRGIFDDHASHLAHMSRRDPTHRWGVRRMLTVQHTLLRCPPDLAAILSLAYVPFGAGRASYRLLTALAWEGLPLVALGLRSQAMGRLWGARRPDVDPTPAAMLDLLNDEVFTLKRGNRIPSGHRLFGVWQESITTCQGAVRSYAWFRGQVMTERRKQRQADNILAAEAARREMGGK